ncbi:MAG: hypothetical protein K2G47_08045 [Muribaculum sp.]|nr:hypothetical protein [Muribaculum sp.]
MNGITEIWEAVNSKAGEFFEWAQAHPKFGLLLVAALLLFWLTGLVLRCGWALHWQNNGKMWIFDDCKPETKRRIQIFLVTVALLSDLMLFFLWK